MNELVNRCRVSCGNFLKGEPSMKKIVTSIALVIGVLGVTLSVATVVNAQNREKFVISAKAGGVNAISGRAEVRSTPGADWQLLSVTDDLKSGDMVKTSNDGRLEVLLNPGSYLRVAENSEFQLTDSSLDNLEVKLLRGMAIVEATGADETQLAIGITTPHARMTIVRRGLYRVNVVPGDATELFVRKGRVLLGSSQTKVKDGYKVIFRSTTLTVAKLEKADKQKSEFEDWSKQRGQTVALANRRIQTRDLNAFLYGYDDWFYSGSFRRGGLWLFNPRARCWTFLPFFYGWGSPYGSSYSCTYYQGPRWGAWPVGNRGGGWSNGTGSGTGSGSGSSSGSGTGIGRNPNPPTRVPDPPARTTERRNPNPDGGGRQRVVPPPN